MVIDGKNTICEKFWGKKEREFERDEREMREEGEMRENGVGRPFLFFSHQPGHAGAQRAVLKCDQVPNSSFCCSGIARLPKLVFLPFLISNASQVR